MKNDPQLRGSYESSSPCRGILTQSIVTLTLFKYFLWFLLLRETLKESKDFNKDIVTLSNVILTVFNSFMWCLQGREDPIGCLKLLVSFGKRATNYRAFLQKMTYTDIESYGSLLLPCTLVHVNSYFKYTQTYLCRDMRTSTTKFLAQHTWTLP